MVQEIQFLVFLAYTEKGGGVTRWDPANVISRMKLYMYTKIKICRSKGFSGRIPFFGVFFSLPC